MIADSLQAAADTVVVVQSQSNSLLDWFSFGASILIALFTGGYLWYTTKIFQQTKKQAESSEQSAEASQEAAAAAQVSNVIAKRSQFYPVFDFRIMLEGTTARQASARLDNMSENVAFDVSIFYLIWHAGGAIETAKQKGEISGYTWLSKEYNLLAGRHEVGNLKVDKHWRESFKTDLDMERVLAVVRYSDALENTYYKSITYQKDVDPTGPPKLIRKTVDTTSLSPHSVYTLSSLGEGNMMLVPTENPTSDLDALTGDQVPSPVREYNQQARNSTARILFDG